MAQDVEGLIELNFYVTGVQQYLHGRVLWQRLMEYVTRRTMEAGGNIALSRPVNWDVEVMRGMVPQDVVEVLNAVGTSDLKATLDGVEGKK